MTANATVFAVIPVFNRLHFTRDCILRLKEQCYQPIQIIVSDGGSTDGTVAAIRNEYPDVVVLTSETELWWAGSMELGIDYVLNKSQNASDFVLMMNNDTLIPIDYVTTLVQTSTARNAAVGALVVDSRDTRRVLDAGEYIDWENYTFPVKQSVNSGEVFCDDVDVLPGRGSLIPLRMIRKSGNVNAGMLPHYLADYEFFYRLKQHGFHLGVCYDTHILAHIEETGIVPTNGRSGFRLVWCELFSRRSMSNVIDHWRFVCSHAPKQYRGIHQRRLLRRIFAELSLRTPLRPFFLPIYWVFFLPFRLAALVQGQRRSFCTFAQLIRQRGPSVLCQPENFPGSIRLALYLLAAPGPIKHADLEKTGLKPELLIGQGVLRQLSVDGWYAFQSLDFSSQHEASKLRGLFWSEWNPMRKLVNTLAWHRAMLNRFET